MEKCRQWVQCDILQFLNHKIIASAFEAKNKMFVYKGQSALSQVLQEIGKVVFVLRTNNIQNAFCGGCLEHGSVARYFASVMSCGCKVDII